MCRELEALRNSVAQYARRFDAGSLIPSQAEAIVAACSSIEASVSSIKAMAAAVVAEGSSWKREGYRSPADQLAAKTGTAPSRAKKVLDTGRRLKKHPEVAQAALSGELSPEQTAVVAEGAAANPAKARELVDKARNSSLGELSDEVARTKAGIADLEARRREIHAGRSLKTFKDTDGRFHTRAVGHPEDGTKIVRVIAAIRRRLNLLAREDGRVERLDALEYDALINLMSVALGEDSTLDIGELLDLGLFPQLRTARLSPDASCACNGSHSSAGSWPDGVPRPTGPPPADSAPSGLGARPGCSAPSGPGARPGSPAPPGSAPSGPGVSAASPPSPGTEESSAPASPGDHQAHLFPMPANGTSAANPVAPPDTGPPGRKARVKLVGPPPKIIVRVDLDTLLRGFPMDGELCEIVGFGPVPVSVIEGLLSTGNAFVAAVLTNHYPLAVHHHGRFANTYQRTALEFLYPTCAAKGCNALVRDADHRIDWTQLHYTAFHLLDGLCRHHHNLKTHQGWGLVDGIGKRAFVPPDHPDHPNQRLVPNGP